MALLLSNTGRKSQNGEFEEWSILGMIPSFTDKEPHMGVTDHDNLL